MLRHARADKNIRVLNFCKILITCLIMIHMIQIFTCAQVRFYKHRLFYYFDLICLCFFLFLLKSKTFFLSVTSTRQTGSDFDTANRRRFRYGKPATSRRQTGDCDTANRRRCRYRKPEIWTWQTGEEEKAMKRVVRDGDDV